MSRIDELFTDPLDDPAGTPPADTADTAATAGSADTAATAGSADTADTADTAEVPPRGFRARLRSLNPLARKSAHQRAAGTAEAVLPGADSSGDDGSGAAAHRAARKKSDTVEGNPDYAGAIIELEDVTRFFPGPPPVNALRGVNLTVERGDYLAIVGPSGSGKSTMLNTLGLLDRPSTGRFLFEGIDVSTLSDDERSALRGRAVGFVFQSFHLMPTRTVLENVMLAGTYAGLTRDEREPLARTALERVGLSHRMDFSPNTLSGGERQRVAIARAVCTSPRLLLADEPTGNLDRENSAAIMRLFDELSADGLTIVMITHDQHVAEVAKRRVRIRDGELSELS